MGYRELEERIKSDSRRDAEAVAKAAEEEAGRITEESCRAAYEASAKVLVHGERAAALRSRQVVGAAKLNSMRILSAEKNRLLDKVFADAMEAFKALPEDRKAAFLGRLAGDASSSGWVERVRVDRSCRRLLGSMNGVEVVEEDLGGFGVILESADGSMRIDSRLSTILDQAKARLKPQVSKITFG